MGRTTITKEDALREFGSGRVEGAEMVTLMRNDRHNTGQQEAYIGEKWWKFLPSQNQLDTMVQSR
jgi:uncharacterized ferritin-like protein (DUF455 family)